MSLLSCVEIEPDGDVEGSIVWLHGLGASGHDFEDIVPLLELPGIRFVFPHAPSRAVTINMGLIMPAWYDIEVMGGERQSHVRDSAELVEALLERERQRGVASERTVIAGFSQGAAMALFVGMRHADPLLGILALSGYEVLAHTREAEATEANRVTPLLMCHGLLDPMVPVDRGRRAFAAAAPGRQAEWREFPIGHEVSLEEIAVVRDWLHGLLALSRA